MMKKLLKKLRSSKGFSMGEMLVATLILGLMTTALASGISSAQRIYYDSVTYSEKRMLLSTICDTIRTELRYAKEVKFKKDDSGTPDTTCNEEYDPENNNLYVVNSYTSPNYGFYTQLSSVKKSNPKFNKLSSAEASATVNKTYSLVGSGVYSDSKLEVRLLAGSKMTDDEKSNGTYTVAYDKSKNVFVVTVQVYKYGDDPDVTGTNLETRTITVKPLEKPEIPETTNTGT